LNLVCLEVVLTTVMCLVANRLPKFATTIDCEERFSVIKIFNCLFLNVYLPLCVVTSNRLQVCIAVLDELCSYFDNYHECDFVMAGDFNVNLDVSDAVALRVQRLISEYSLVRCDSLFPAERKNTCESAP